MTPASAIALGALLGAVFLVLVGAMLWQELRGRPSSDPLEYVIEDAVQWILPQLDPEQRARLAAPGVRAILEWQVFGLQQSVKGQQRGTASVVMGPTDEMVAYVLSKIDSAEAHDVLAVLAGQFGYLQSIGAMTGEVDGSQT